MPDWNESIVQCRVQSRIVMSSSFFPLSWRVWLEVSFKIRCGVQIRSRNGTSTSPSTQASVQFEVTPVSHKRRCSSTWAPTRIRQLSQVPWHRPYFYRSEMMSQPLTKRRCSSTWAPTRIRLLSQVPWHRPYFYRSEMMSRPLTRSHRDFVVSRAGLMLEEGAGRGVLVLSLLFSSQYRRSDVTSFMWECCSIYRGLSHLDFESSSSSPSALQFDYVLFCLCCTLSVFHPHNTHFQLSFSTSSAKGPFFSQSFTRTSASTLTSSSTSTFNHFDFVITFSILSSIQTLNRNNDLEDCRSSGYCHPRSDRLCPWQND